MSFSTIIFIFFFFPIAVLGNIFIEKLTKNARIRNIYLILISLIFYWFGAKRTDIILIIFLIIINYFLGYLLRNNKSIIILSFGVILNSAILIYFKYPQQIFSILGNPRSDINVIMPLGISFVIILSAILIWP